MSDVIMPKMGDAMEEGVIVQWLKNVGDKVSKDEAIAEIETDKSNVEVPAEADGFVQSINFQPGDTVPVGKVIAVIGAEAPAAGAAAPAAAPKAPEAAAPTSNGTGAAEVKPVAPVAPVAAPAAAKVVVSPSGFKPYDSFVGGLPEGLGGSASVIGEPIVVEGEAGSERVKATPLARAMAQTHNLDLSALRGTGPDGGIVKKDIEAALANGVAPAAAPTAAPVAEKAAPAPTAAKVEEGDEVQEYNAMRRTIAKRLSESKSTIPHFYVTTEIDMEALISLREEINASAGEKQPKVSINDCLIKAAAVALAENPKINSAFSDNKRILRKSFNIGFGVALEDGLIVPVVRDAGSKSLRGVAKETKPLIDKARAGKLSPADYTGGTFTISNMGVFPDIEDFSAIVNPGEGAILAVASTRLVPAVVDGQIVPRKRMKVTLSVDHRVVDGADGAQFLISLKRVIENPLEMLA
jgi:pyruvate dehydrogenase E2 component (dihydrolipoamide acetyltransferase)